MPTSTHNHLSIVPVPRFACKRENATLPALIEDLTRLRFSVLLTGKWAMSSEETPECRAEMRSELAGLRFLYSEKIDEIAMRFGVPEAMHTQEEVERNVTVPENMEKPSGPIDGEGLYF
jgi:hypothetical protein